mmetsp:Transcript_6685/g.21634  ORF Transcript_6685/g.21634 Transcript_6685/m.21634 type:complete len:238 (+) Transcript_6685:132-845(+)
MKKLRRLHERNNRCQAQVRTSSGCCTSLPPIPVSVLLHFALPLFVAFARLPTLWIRLPIPFWWNRPLWRNLSVGRPARHSGPLRQWRLPFPPRCHQRLRSTRLSMLQALATLPRQTSYLSMPLLAFPRRPSLRLLGSVCTAMLGTWTRRCSSPVTTPPTTRLMRTVGLKQPSSTLPQDPWTVPSFASTRPSSCVRQASASGPARVNSATLQAVLPTFVPLQLLLLAPSSSPTTRDST